MLYAEEFRKLRLLESSNQKVKARLLNEEDKKDIKVASPTDVDKYLKQALESKTNLLFTYKPGTGVLARIKRWANINRINLVIASSVGGSESDDLGGAVSQQPQEENNIITDIKKLRQAVSKARSVLVFPELDQESRKAQGAILNLIDKSNAPQTLLFTIGMCPVGKTVYSAMKSRFYVAEIGENKKNEE